MSKNFRTMNHFRDTLVLRSLCLGRKKNPSALSVQIGIFITLVPVARTWHKLAHITKIYYEFLHNYSARAGGTSAKITNG